MTVDSIQNGTVIDHIAAGGGMKLYHLLELEKAEVPVAIMMNVTSHRLGRKDIIKIDGEMPLNFDVIGYVDPDATVNVIRNGVLQEKKQMVLPTHLKNVLRCKNPRCISGSEQELPQIFVLTDRIHKEYRCYWCETRAAQL
ncbi:MAG: aspartate carbamoyltransferase regulatory subunit [Clostridia bacterium]|nr:aspartate carbamoyltransferase regulatory subunit [Clostridia bacterium]